MLNGVETDKEQPNYLECLFPTRTLTKGKKYHVTPYRWYYSMGYILVEHGVNFDNLNLLQVVNDNGEIIKVKPFRFNLKDIKF